MCLCTTQATNHREWGVPKNERLELKSSGKNQALFRKYTALDGSLKKQIVRTVELVLLSKMVDQLTGFGQAPALIMLQNLFARYGAIDGIDLKENAVKMMGTYDSAEPLA